MESEYIAPSLSLQTTIPFMAITEAINEGLDFVNTQILSFKAPVHEDNMGTLGLAQLEQDCNTPY